MIGKVTLETVESPQAGQTLIFIVFEHTWKKDPFTVSLNEATGGMLMEKATRHEFDGKFQEMLRLENSGGRHAIYLAGAGGKDMDQAKFRSVLAGVFRQMQSHRETAATVMTAGGWNAKPFSIGESLALSLHLANYRFFQFKSDETRKKFSPVKEIVYHAPRKISADIHRGIDYGTAAAEGVYLTRDLVNRPASHLHPLSLEEEAFALAKASGGAIEVEVLDRDECRNLGMGSFLGVAQGSVHPPKFIVLSYKPEGKSGEPLAIVGKSITFDSGGLSLKPADSMMDMKIDMAGGAAVLGVFKALAILAKTGKQLPAFPVYGVLPACENMPSGSAMRPGDILTAMNGKTIEVLNTDAEGRLTLADALVYAEKKLKADRIIDLATLTGACMVALGDEVTGCFGNDRDFTRKFLETAKSQGEQAWELPLYRPYLKKMKSDVAELKNIGGGRYGGAITAALFLSEFVNKAKWIHLDIAGPASREGGDDGLVPKGGTGWGVMTLLEFINNLQTAE